MTQTRIDVRLPAETEEIIERAAAIRGITVSQFVVRAAREAAEQVLNDHATWQLSRRDSRAFVKALLHPPEPNAALLEAAARYASRGHGGQPDAE